MQVRIVRMRMPQWFVAMPVTMGFSAIPAIVVCVLMMRVVGMRMFVFERVVLVLMLMVFADVQPDPERHQRCGPPECGIRRFLEPQQRQ